MSVGQLVYSFGDGRAEGDRGMRDLLGGKGANLAEMTQMGIPVPPGFTISTRVCTHFAETSAYPSDLRPMVDEALRRMEALVGRRFGDPERPLLVSVRSGAAVSMPGMMDTVLNLGLNDVTVEGLARESSNPRFAYDAYRRLLQMYGDVVMGVEHHHFERALENRKQEAGPGIDAELPAEALRTLVREFQEIIRRESRRPFPQPPDEQLWGAIGAVFTSWSGRRAVSYRRLEGIPDTLGTAVNVQAMVFGNLGEDSATGVVFTRNPSTGDRELYGEYLVNAQGEDVVAGKRTPKPIRRARGDGSSLEERLPQTFRELTELAARLEAHYRDIQDVEFTVERGRLWILQTRTGKRTPAAAVRSAVEMVAEGLIDEATAVGRIDPRQLETLLHPSIDEDARFEVIATGLAASPGAASGMVVFSADEAAARGMAGEPVILVRQETSPEDIHGMAAAQAILTARGGTTSHAAVVARGMGKCCVAGCTEIEILPDGSGFRVGVATVQKGDWITLDGSTGRVILGRVATRPAELKGEFRTLLEWCDRFRRLGVRANADTPHDARQAIGFGAEGIGLCRTEHMFFDEERILLVRKMIFASGEMARRAALDELLPLQRQDFEGIFHAMEGRPVTIRLLDPPLHEFLPREEDDLSPIARGLGVPEAEIRNAISRLAEANPMLGHRGCRLGITYPEITEMQARAMAEAACEVAASGVPVALEIMIPLVGVEREFTLQAQVIGDAVDDVFTERGMTLPYLIGTMIELPRACLTAGEIAREADFFSFGTNDLTQTTFGLSRDDSGKFLQIYLDQGIYEADPFAVLDTKGVGRLIEMGVTLGRAERPTLKVGICGEHGGEPSSVGFCHRIGLDYVSCSPFRVPVARLAAAQAALAESGEEGRRVMEERLAAR